MLWVYEGYGKDVYKWVGSLNFNGFKYDVFKRMVYSE